MTPLLGVLVLRDDAAFVARIKRHDFGVEALRRFCAFIAVHMVSRPGLYSFLGLVVVVGLGLNYASLQPRYRLADQVPDRQRAVAASERLDVKLAGANLIDVLIEFPPGASLYAPETLNVIASVHAILEKQQGVGNVWSLETLRRWLAEKAHKSDVAVLKQYVDMLPEHLRGRFISSEGDAVVVSGRVPDVDASRLLPIVDSLDKTLAGVRAAHPGYTIAVTGLSAIAARNSANMIAKLNRGLTIEFAGVAFFLGLAFRSVVVMFSAILPGIFPIVASGLLLRLTGVGLQFASVVALTVSFGLGLSATIHFLNRARLEDSPTPTPPSRSNGGACRGPDGAGSDSDIGGAGLRTGGYGVLQLTVAAAVRVAERLRDDRGPGRRSFDFAPDDDVPAPNGASPRPEQVCPLAINGVSGSADPPRKGGLHRSHIGSALGPLYGDRRAAAMRGSLCRRWRQSPRRTHRPECRN